MTTTINWAVSNLERETCDGFVYLAHWTVSASDDTYSAGAYGNVPFERPEELIAFASLTPDLVVSWIKEALTAEKVAEIENALQVQLDEQRAPSKAGGVPWPVG